jgi:DNA sulfur modification protein DndD
MIINKLQIENFGCYYESNEFKLSNGLNIILGGNGEGKTMFYKALKWLFEGDLNDQELEGLGCEKKLSKIDNGKSFKVSVSVYLEWNDAEYIIKRSFIITKKEDNESSVSENSLDIKIKRKNGELDLVDSPQMVIDNQLFPFEIRNYSMFEGESNLDIFKKEESLIQLINLFSNAKKYDGYSQKAEFLAKKAEDALASMAKLNDTKKSKYKRLEGDIGYLKNKIDQLKSKIKNSEKEIYNFNSQIDQLKKEADNSHIIVNNEKKIKLHKDKIDDLFLRIKDNYTESLFDQSWILQNFNDYYDEFSKIIDKASKERSKAQKKFHEEEGLKRLGIIHGKTPLPVYVPNKEIMQQLLDEEVCKVCNREAKKGSDAYAFMNEKLNELIKSEQPDIDDKELFLTDTVRDLDTIKAVHDRDKRSFNGIKEEIKEIMDFNDARKLDIKDHEKEIKKLQDEIDKVTGKSGHTSESAKSSYNTLSSILSKKQEEEYDRNKYLVEIKDKEEELSNKQLDKDKMDNESGSTAEKDTRDILRDISKIFNDTKTDKFHLFIDKIENVSNKFLKEINVDSFTGEIKFERNISKYTNSVKLQLRLKNNKLFSSPNQSLLTSVYISILFSVSELSKETTEEYFPLIFDAPTSTFDNKKISQFLNSIYNTPTQKIIVTKDYVIQDESTKGGVIKISDEFKKVKRNKAFWVKLKRPLDGNEISTIQSEIYELS